MVRGTKVAVVFLAGSQAHLLSSGQEATFSLTEDQPLVRKHNHGSAPDWLYEEIERVEAAQNQTENPTVLEQILSPDWLNQQIEDTDRFLKEN